MSCCANVQDKDHPDNQPEKAEAWYLFLSLHIFSALFCLTFFFSICLDFLLYFHFRVGTDGKGSIKDKERGCTDIFFALLLIGCWLAMTLLGFCALGWIESDSIKAGNPNRLVRATDYLGQVCGVDGDIGNAKNKEQAYYFYTGSVVCIDGCPKKVGSAFS